LEPHNCISVEGADMIDPTLDDLAELPIWLAWQGEAAAKSGAPPGKVPYAANNRPRSASWRADLQPLGSA
jgi:hypothetical protein